MRLVEAPLSRALGRHSSGGRELLGLYCCNRGIRAKPGLWAPVLQWRMRTGVQRVASVLLGLTFAALHHDHK